MRDAASGIGLDSATDKATVNLSSRESAVSFVEAFNTEEIVFTSELRDEIIAKVPIELEKSRTIIPTNIESLVISFTV